MQIGGETGEVVSWLKEQGRVGSCGTIQLSLCVLFVERCPKLEILPALKSCFSKWKLNDRVVQGQLVVYSISVKIEFPDSASRYGTSM